MEIKKGDRVKVFRGGRAPFKGKVEAVTGESSIQVIEDGFYSVHDDAPFHPRQLVRLIPKPKKETRVARRAWLHPNAAKKTIHPSLVMGSFLSRELLAAAYKEADLMMNYAGDRTTEAWFNELCKALNLPPLEEK